MNDLKATEDKQEQEFELSYELLYALGKEELSNELLKALGIEGLPIVGLSLGSDRGSTFLNIKVLAIGEVLEKTNEIRNAIQASRKRERRQMKLNNKKQNMTKASANKLTRLDNSGQEVKRKIVPKPQYIEGEYGELVQLPPSYKDYQNES